MKQIVKCQECGEIHEIKIPWRLRKTTAFLEIHCICGHLIRYNYNYKLKILNLSELCKNYIDNKCIYDVLACKGWDDLCDECKEAKGSAGSSVNTNSKSSELVPKVGIATSNNAKSGSIPADPKADSYDLPKCPYCDILFHFDINDELFDCPHCNREVSICELINNIAIFLQTQIKSKIATKLRAILKKRGAIIDDPSYPDGDQSFKRWLKKIEKDIKVLKRS